MLIVSAQMTHDIHFTISCARYGSQHLSSAQIITINKRIEQTSNQRYGRTIILIDRGNVGVVLFNFGKEDFEVSMGDRIAQMIPAARVDELTETERGAGGFGSTGVEGSLGKKARTISATDGAQAQGMG